MIQANISSWLPCFIYKDEFALHHLEGLIFDTYSVIVIDNFIPTEVCQEVSCRFRNHLNLLEYKQENVSTQYIGHSLVEMSSELELYFEKVQDMFSAISTLYQGNLGEDVKMAQDLVIDLLNKVWKPGAIIASEGNNNYFAGIVRAIKRSPLHNDFAPRDFPELSIGKISEQLAWNLYLSSPNNGEGKVKIYKRNWKRSDSQYKHNSSKLMGYSYEVVSEVPSVSIEPTVGRLILFKTSNYHEVLKNNTDDLRISASSFIGFKNNSSPLILWS